jgi:hypothetical protein
MKGSRWISANFSANVNRILKQPRSTEFRETADEVWKPVQHLTSAAGPREKVIGCQKQELDSGKCEDPVQ